MSQTYTVIISHKKHGVVAAIDPIPQVKGAAYLRLWLYSQGVNPHNPEILAQYTCSECPLIDTRDLLAMVSPTTFTRNEG